nr:Gag-Pol polyprotein [Tanacetum cinerariifolium]
DALSKLMNYALVSAGTNSNDFAGKGESFDAGQSSMETGSSQDYILMPLWKDNSLFDSSSQALDGHNKDKHGPSQATEKVDCNNLETVILVSLIPSTRIHKDHPKEHIIGDMKRVTQALDDESWVEAMQEELLQFKLLNVWILVDLPPGKRVIGTKWVYRNKRDQKGIDVRNKVRLVSQGHR